MSCHNLQFVCYFCVPPLVTEVTIQWVWTRCRYVNHLVAEDLFATNHARNALGGENYTGTYLLFGVFERCGPRTGRKKGSCRLPHTRYVNINQSAIWPRRERAWYLHLSRTPRNKLITHFKLGQHIILNYAPKPGDTTPPFGEIRFFYTRTIGLNICVNPSIVWMQKNAHFS
jgi:hypothetical protein